MNDKINVPFSDVQVEKLKEWQENGLFHPFTCGGAHCDRGEREDEGLLIPRTEGWICPCGKYQQFWAHKFMAE